MGEGKVEQRKSLTAFRLHIAEFQSLHQYNENEREKIFVRLSGMCACASYIPSPSQPSGPSFGIHRRHFSVLNFPALIDVLEYCIYLRIDRVRCELWGWTGVWVRVVCKNNIRRRIASIKHNDGKYWKWDRKHEKVEVDWWCTTNIRCEEGRVWIINTYQGLQKRWIEWMNGKNVVVITHNWSRNEQHHNHQHQPKWENERKRTCGGKKMNLNKTN